MHGLFGSPRVGCFFLFFSRHVLGVRQGFRVFTKEMDGNRSINSIAREQAAPVLGEAPPQEEFFREYRAFGAVRPRRACMQQDRQMPPSSAAALLLPSSLALLRRCMPVLRL